MTNVTSADDRDSRLAALLDELTEAARGGMAPRLEEVAARHPDLAEELCGLWGTVLVAGAMGSATNDFAESPDDPRQAPSPDDLPDYELQEELGRGGMGIVYRAWQPSLRRNVAVKLILRGTLASTDEQARFQAEAAAAGRLQHPHIVPIYEVASHNGQCYFSMQLVEGTTLAERLAEGPLPAPEAARLMVTVARAIHYAHAQGVIHRDLKPANILLDVAGEPHITDFGLAKQLDAGASLTRTGAVLGTPAYMAPELASGDRGAISPASDVYSLGTILYALLTGRPPFQGPSPVDTVLMVLEQDPLPPRLLNRKLDRDLEMIVLKCLQKPPELRYVSAAALADDLEAYLHDEPISARSGQFSQVVARVFRETHHATVLENWGLLWMWHAAVILVMCVVTNRLHAMRGEWPQCARPWPYLLLWGGGLALWAPIFWKLRHRIGPVTAVERQIAHIWGGSVAAVVLLFVVEWLLRLPVLTLSPVLGLIGGAVFVAKAGILSGLFYLQAAAMFATALVMAELQRRGIDYGVTLYGVVSALAFFLPGWKYYRQSRATSRKPFD
ncbi:MAG: serine/threonine-protein kinase [Pirellulales bacterium]